MVVVWYHYAHREVQSKPRGSRTLRLAGREQLQQEKRGPYMTYSATVSADIGKYVCQHGVAAAARHFAKKLASRVSETTVRSIKSTSLKSLQQKRGTEDELSLPRWQLPTLPCKYGGLSHTTAARTRPLYTC